MIFILVPVHNRLHHVMPFVRDLAAQLQPPRFRVVVIDAGSTDGTLPYLRTVAADPLHEVDLEYVEGHASWWWSRCISEGLSRIQVDLMSEDKVLIINDDVSLGPTYLRRIFDFSNNHPLSLVTSCLVAPDAEPAEPFHFGVLLDTNNLTFLDAPDPSDPTALIHSEVASGRGTLFPAMAIQAGVRPRVRQLPHYLADYDMGVQARNHGYDIVGRRDIYVTTDTVQGNSKRFDNAFQYRMRAESPGRLLNWWYFWSSPALGIGRIRLSGRMLRRALNTVRSR